MVSTVETPDSSPAYLAHCIESFLNAMSEARGLALVGDSGEQVVETLRFASDLLDIIARGMDGLTSDPTALDAVAHLREELNVLRGLLAANNTVQ